MSRSVRHLVLSAIVALALIVRVTALDAYGFSDDESSKVAAIGAYRAGDFSANAEHPMLMKLVMWGSVVLSERWNAIAPVSSRISPETALRLPNAIVGAATVIIVYGVVALLFSAPTALASAALIGLDPNITALNRIGKEDTFLMFFFFLAMLCYERAKRVGVTDVAHAKRWYQKAAGCWGLMLASKYMPHFYGLFVLYNVIDQYDPGPNRPDPGRYYATMAKTFVLANFAVLLPSTWAYCVAYVRARGMTHHGEMYANQLYVTEFPLSFAGIPFTYYLDLIGMKVPLVVLAAACVGLIPLVKRRRERGFVWLRVLLVFLVIGYSVFAAKFQRYGLPMLIFVDILAAVGLMTGIGWIRERIASRVLSTSMAVAIVALVFAGITYDLWSVAPFYSVHQNAIGARLAAPATRFPEEAYDFGTREAVAEIATLAGRGAALVTDAPGAVSIYVARSGRHDLDVRSLSTEKLPAAGEQWVFVQDDHIYFENQGYIEQLRRQQKPWREYRIRNTPVLQVFRVGS